MNTEDKIVEIKLELSKIRNDTPGLGRLQSLIFDVIQEQNSAKQFVFIIMGFYSFEGGVFVGSYSEEQLSIDRAKELKSNDKFDWIEIYKIRLNERFDYSELKSTHYIS